MYDPPPGYLDMTMSATADPEEGRQKVTEFRDQLYAPPVEPEKAAAGYKAPPSWWDEDDSVCSALKVVAPWGHTVAAMRSAIAAIAAGTVLGLVLFAGMGLVFMKWGADPSKDSLVSL